jgi:hypothetical protein
MMLRKGVDLTHLWSLMRRGQSASFPTSAARRGMTKRGTTSSSPMLYLVARAFLEPPLVPPGPIAGT